MWPSQCLWALVPSPRALAALYDPKCCVFSPAFDHCGLVSVFPPRPPIPKSPCSHVELSATELPLVLLNYSRSSHPSKYLPQLKGDPGPITAGEAELSLQLQPNSSTRELLSSGENKSPGKSELCTQDLPHPDTERTSTQTRFIPTVGVLCVFMSLLSEGPSGWVRAEWSPAPCSSMGNIHSFVPGIPAPVHSDVGQQSIRDNDMDFRQCHVIAFLVDRCSGWLGNTATEHGCQREMGEQCKWKGRRQFLLE